MSRLARFVATLLLLAGLCMPAAAQTYSNDTSAATQAAYPWIDISATGTGLSLTDDQVSGAVAIGFTFTYGATSFTTVQVSANGMLHFNGSTTTAYTDSALPLTGASGEPNIDTVMLPLWDDLQPNGSGNYIRYQTIGTAPNRVFVVSWLAVPYYCYTGSASGCNNTTHQTTTLTATFQVQIHEQGQFVYRYGLLDGSGGTHGAGPTLSNPAGATVGYELSNTDYSQFSFHAASVPNNTTILWYRPSVAPGNFNAFDTSTAAGSTTGVIHTKIAGASFPLAVVALNSAKTALASTFNGTVKVELLDASNNTGALNAGTGCRSTWTTVLQSGTVAFAVSDAGRDTISFTENNAWRDVRVRVSYPATGTATVVACSTDDFAIRPAAFGAFSASDTDWQTAGTTRTLANGTAAGGNVHKAGQPFTIRATAQNAQATPATTSNYTGTPTATVSACAGTACTATFGTLGVSLAATAGVIVNTTATYSEAGAFSLQLTDSTFASVDGADGSTASELAITSPVITVGRFVPDHFDVVSLVAPVLKTFGTTTCAARSFTYVGQPFGYATAPQATVLARNASGATTANYAGALWKITAASVSQTYAPLAPASPGLSAAGSAPSLTSNANGTGVIAAVSTDTLQFARSATTPAAPFNAAISLTWSVADGNETGVAGNGTIATAAALAFNPIAFDAGTELRWGVLKLASAYGSPLNNLALTFETQYWDGLRFRTNSADQCTTLATSTLAMANWRQSLAACDTGLAAANVKVSAGRAFFTLAKPPAGRYGSTDVTPQLGAAASGQTCVGSTSTAAIAAGQPWLQGKWNNSASYDQNPTARAAFGPYRSPLIYLHESF